MLNVPVTQYMLVQSSLHFHWSVYCNICIGATTSATGMQACTLNGGICDTWDKADDGTENQQDWIEGTYEFDLADTSTINMEMSWALREFNRSTLGLMGRCLTPH